MNRCEMNDPQLFNAPQKESPMADLHWVPAGMEYQQFAAEGSICLQQHITLSTGAAVRIFRFIPPGNSVNPAIVLVSGLVSVMDNFGRVIRSLSQDFELYLFETREKSSARVLPEMRFTVPELAEDLTAWINSSISPLSYVLMGYSLGAAVLVESFSSLTKKPVMLVMAEPSAEFAFPSFLLFISHFAAPFYTLIKPIILWYSKFFRINSREDHELNHIMKRALDSASGARLCKTLRDISTYRIWDKLSEIKVPVLLIGASKDTLHIYSETLRIQEMLSECNLIDLETNYRNHGIEVADEIRKKLTEVN